MRNAATLVADDRTRSLLVAVEEFLQRVLLHDMHEQPVISGSESLLSYLRFKMAYLPYEQVRAVFLDPQNHVIDDEVVAKGTISSSPIYPREIIRRALVKQAMGVILVHNHPSGDPAPSAADIASTRQLERACREMDIQLVDHVILSKRGWTSFKLEGLFA